MNVSKNIVSCLKIKRESTPVRIGSSQKSKQTNKSKQISKKGSVWAGKTNIELTIGFHVYGINLLLADRTPPGAQRTLRVDVGL